MESIYSSFNHPNHEDPWLNSKGGKHATEKNVMKKIHNLKQAKQANLEQIKTSSTAKASASSAGEAHGVDL